LAPVFSRMANGEPCLDRARETARQSLLMIRLLEQYLDLFGLFETICRLSWPKGGRDGDSEESGRRYRR